MAPGLSHGRSSRSVTSTTGAVVRATPTPTPTPTPTLAPPLLALLLLVRESGPVEGARAWLRTGGDSTTSVSGSAGVSALMTLIVVGTGAGVA